MPLLEQIPLAGIIAYMVVGKAFRFDPGLMRATSLIITVGVAALNALTFTNYTGGDPEIARDFENAADRNMSSNITWLSAPQEKSYSFNVNIKF